MRGLKSRFGHPEFIDRGTGGVIWNWLKRFSSFRLSRSKVNVTETLNRFYFNISPVETGLF